MLLKKLCECAAVSGNEKAMREIIKEELTEMKIPFSVDRMGNLIARKEKEGKKKVLLYTHMDEPGMMIYDIDGAGLLKFMMVGGLKTEALMSKPVVVGEESVKGVIGAKAIHLQEASERSRILDNKSLYIDIGAKDEEDAKKQIQKGHYAAVYGPLRELEAGFLTGKFLESRVGIAVILATLQKELDVDVTALFTTMHHVGNRGEQVFMEKREFDYAIGVCGGGANDSAYSDEVGSKVSLKKGAGLKLLDGRTVFQRDFYETTIKQLEEKDIPYQVLVEPRENSSFYHLAKRSTNIKGTEVFLPVRYSKTPVAMIHKEDCESAKTIIETILKGIEGGKY